VTQDGGREDGHVARSPRREQVRVAHDRRVFVVRPGVLHVFADGAEARGAFALQEIAFDQNLRPMADGGDEFAAFHRILHEAHGLHVGAHLVRSHAAGDDDGVELFGERVGGCPVGLHRELHLLALILFVDARAEHGHFRTRFLKRVVRNEKFTVLDVVLDQNGDFLGGAFLLRHGFDSFDNSDSQKTPRGRRCANASVRSSSEQIGKERASRRAG
jgi:hypothetical protein